MTLENGYQLQQGRYTIQSVLGEGGMGTVYLATDRNLPGRLVAIKENSDASQSAQEQFQQEAVLLARLTHPNLPRVTDHFVEPSGLQYLVMDYVEGDDLREVLRQQGGPLPEPLVLAWIEQVMNALEHMHNWIEPSTRRPSPIIHRDIKPGNIKRTPNGRIVLVDFGLAKYESDDEPTVVGARAFTPGYSPVEQYSGGTNVRSDIYALGATLYNLLTGQRPPDATVLAGGAPLTPPRQFNPQISRNTERVILRAMQAQDSERFQNMRAMRDALLNRRSSAEGSQPLPPKSEYTLSTYTKRTKRRIPGVISWLIGLLILSLIAAMLLWPNAVARRWRTLLRLNRPHSTAVTIAGGSATTMTTTPTAFISNAVVTTTITTTTVTATVSSAMIITTSVTNTATGAVTTTTNNLPPTIIPMTLTLTATPTLQPATATSTATPSASATATATSSATAGPTATATRQPSPTLSPTSNSPSPTSVIVAATPTATVTIRPTATVTPLPTTTPTVMVTTAPTVQPSATATPLPTPSPIPTATVTATRTATITRTATPTRTATSEPPPTATATITPTPTATRTPTPRPTATRTATVPPQPTTTSGATTPTVPIATVPIATVAPSLTTTPTVRVLQATPASGDKRVNPRDQATYVFVPGGEFLMGSATVRDEQPEQTVTVDSFWIGQTEVTNAQYARCVEAEACTPPHNDHWNNPDQADFPVTHVDWEQANRYAQWAGGRLPTEAEWEKAARGTDGRTFPWGNEATNEQPLNFNSTAGVVAVGSYPNGASPYGALDMAGNVEEWVADWYAPDAYAQFAGPNPTGPPTGFLRVVRGGSFKSSWGVVRTSVRGRVAPAANFDNVGFRVVVPSL